MKTLFRTFALGAALACAAGAAGAQTKIDLAVFHPEGDAFSGAIKHWIEQTSARTNGAVVLTPHWASSLAKLTETYGAVRDGIIPAGTTAAGVLSGQIPAMAYIEIIGGLPGDSAAAKAAAQKLRPVLSKMLGDRGVAYAWMQGAFGGLAACRDAHLKTPADWRGKKVRTAGRWQSQQLLALGATPVTIDPAEQYIALRQGTVDCVLSNNTLALGLKLHEVGAKITQLRQPVNATIYLVNPRTMSGLSDAHRRAVLDAGAAAETFGVDFLLERQESAAATMKSQGADIYTLSDAELAAFKAAVRPVIARIDESAGEAGKPIADVLKPYW